MSGIWFARIRKASRNETNSHQFIMKTNTKLTKWIPEGKISKCMQVTSGPTSDPLISPSLLGLGGAVDLLKSLGPSFNTDLSLSPLSTAEAGNWNCSKGLSEPQRGSQRGLGKGGRRSWNRPAHSGQDTPSLGQGVEYSSPVSGLTLCFLAAASR